MGKYTVQCEVCGKTITGATKRRRYCGPICRKAAFTARERALRDETAQALDRLRAVMPDTAREIDQLIETHGARAAESSLRVAAVAMTELSRKVPKA